MLKSLNFPGQTLTRFLINATSLLSGKTVGESKQWEDWRNIGSTGERGRESGGRGERKRIIIVIMYFFALFRYRPHDSKADLVSTDSGAMGSKKSGDINVVKFSTGDPPHSKRIWKCAVEQHTFFRYSSHSLFLLPPSFSSFLLLLSSLLPFLLFPSPFPLSLSPPFSSPSFSSTSLSPSLLFPVPPFLHSSPIHVSQIIVFEQK